MQKNWLADLSRSFKIWHISLYNIKNATLFSITTKLIRKVLKYWEAVQLIAESLLMDKFSKNSDFSLKVWILSLATILSVVILKVTGSFLFIFEKMPAKDQVWSLSGTLLINNGVPWKKWLVQLATLRIAHVFFSWDTHHGSECGRWDLCILLILPHLTVKCSVLKGQDLIISWLYQRHYKMKLALFFFFLCRAWSWRIQILWV